MVKRTGAFLMFVIGALLVFGAVFTAELSVMGAAEYTGCAVTGLGLTRKDFDFAAQTITVNKTWGYKKGSGAQFEPTKNASSIRTIQVDWITLQKFSDLIKDIPESEPIFRYGRQYSMCNSCANDILEAKCKQLGIPVISVHGLRHTHASLLLAAGVSIASVSKRLGHSNMSTTQNIYLHIIRELENKDNALAISSMLNIG